MVSTTRSALRRSRGADDVADGGVSRVISSFSDEVWDACNEGELTLVDMNEAEDDEDYNDKASTKSKARRTSGKGAASVSVPAGKGKGKGKAKDSQKVYRKASPAPELKQATFPAARKTVRQKKATTTTKKTKTRHSLPTSFGATKRVEQPSSSSRATRQSTLTQIGWVPSTFPDDDDEDDDRFDVRSLMDLSDREEDGGGGELDAGAKGLKVSFEPPATKQKSKKQKVQEGAEKRSNRGRNRKQTTGLARTLREADGESEAEEVVSSSKFYTQTLTQMPSWRQSQEDDGGLADMVFDELDDAATGIGHNLDAVDSTSHISDVRDTPPSRKRKRPSLSTSNNDANHHLEEQSSTLPSNKQTASLNPTTPSAQRTFQTEVPNSQPSPFTPDGRSLLRTPKVPPTPGLPHSNVQERFLSPFSRGREGVDRTPLKQKSLNVDAPLPIASTRVPQMLHGERSEIADTYSTVNGGFDSTSVPATPAGKAKGGVSQSRRPNRTPLKEITFADVSLELGEQNESRGPGNNEPSQSSPVEEDDIVMDSEDDFQIFAENEGSASAPNSAIRPSQPLPLETHTPRRTYRSSVLTTQQVEIAQSGSAGGAVQSSVAQNIISSQLTHGSPVNENDPNSTNSRLEPWLSGRATSQTPTTKIPFRSPTAKTQSSEVVSRTPRLPSQKATERTAASPAVSHRHSTPEPIPEEDESEPETPSRLPRQSNSSVAVDKETPVTSPQKTSPLVPQVSQMGYYKSQAFESQRVPFEMIRQMAPQTDRSDVIVSIDPDNVKQIVDGVKTHDFRDFRLHQVARIWIYITRPVCQLKYMATISGYKLPGEIPKEERGIGNKEFNDKKGAKYAYELQQVYQLNNPVSLERMKENGWIEQAPEKYEFVPPAVLGELMGNLRCALFEEHEEEHEFEHDQHSDDLDEEAPEDGPKAAEAGADDVNDEDVSVSQELAQQLRSDIQGTTQLMVKQTPSPNRLEPAHQETEDEMTGIVPMSQDLRAEGRSSSGRLRKSIHSQKQVAFAEDSQQTPSSSQRDNQHQHQVEVAKSPAAHEPSRSQTWFRRLNSTTVRPSQATTASAASQSQELPVQYQEQPTSTAKGEISSGNRHSHHRRQGQGASNNSPASQLDDVMVVNESSPVRRTAEETSAGKKSDGDTQSTLGLSMLRSSQALGLLAGIGDEQDSLMDDSRIRLPPTQGEIVWDSEDE